MKKRMISMAMTAVMALTLVVAAAPAEVHATQPTDQKTNVTYTHSNSAAGDGYIITIPSGVNITTADTAVDADVKISNTDGGTYTGTTTVKVTVVSKNAYKLKATGQQDLTYTLKYDNGSALTNVSGNDVAGTLSVSDTCLDGEAMLTQAEADKAAGGVSYSDELTFKFAATAGN